MIHLHITDTTELQLNGEHIYLERPDKLVNYIQIVKKKIQIIGGKHD